MVNFHSPVTLRHDLLVVVKLLYTVDGLYIWEFVTTLDYEWSVIRGRRPYLWTIWIHSLARGAILMAVIINMIGFDIMHPINCQARFTSELVFAYTAVTSSTLLIVLRTFAVWNKNKFVLMVTILIWLASISFYIRRVVQLRTTWVSVFRTCGVLDTESSRQNILATLITDLSLLITMLLGLSRLHLHGGTDSFGHLLWRQGAIWLVLATVAEVPPTVFIFLNLNAPFNTMFQTPAAIMLTIIATRMYRSLVTFHSCDTPQDGLQTDTVLGIKQPETSTEATSQSRSVAAHTHSEPSQASGSRLPTNRYGLHQDIQTAV